MKKIFGYVGIFALATALTMPAAANAGTFVNGAGIGSGAVFANEIFGTGSNVTLIPTGVTATADYTMATGPSSDFMITYTLGGGATWGTALTSGSLAFVETVAPASTVACTLVSGGAITDTTAQFRITVTTPITIGDIFRLTYQVKNANALATVTNKITLGIALTDNLGAVDVARSIDAFTSADGTTEAVAASAAVGSLFIDVATANKNFGGTSADKISATQVKLGSVTITDGGAQMEDVGNVNWSINVGDAAATGTLTVTGNFGASLAVDSDGNPATADGVYLDLNNNGVYNAGEEATTLTGTTATWTLTGANLVTMQTNGATNIHMVVDGNTAITEQSPTATLAINWTNPLYKDESVTGNLRSLAKNGTTKRVFNLPAANNPNNESAYVRIYNTSAVTGNVRGTLYLEDGTSLGTQVIVADMAPQTTAVLSAAQIQSLFGLVSPWTGRARLVIDAELPSMEAMGLIRTSTGILTNMSPMAIQ